MLKKHKCSCNLWYTFLFSKTIWPIFQVILNQTSCLWVFLTLFEPHLACLPSLLQKTSINRCELRFFSLYIIIGCLIRSSSFLRLLFQMSFTTELILNRFQVVLWKKEWMIITHENPYLSKHRPICLTQMWAGPLSFEDANPEHLYVIWKAT